MATLLRDHQRADAPVLVCKGAPAVVLARCTQRWVGAALQPLDSARRSMRLEQSVRQLKDGFPTYTPQDTFNTERIEISRGPGGIAYGDTDATGVINLATKRGRFRNDAEAAARFDDRGSLRMSTDLSRVLVDRRLALRLNLLDSDLEGWHENTARNLRAAAGALRWQPFGSPRTVVDATYEDGRLDSYISHTALNNVAAVYVRGTGTVARDGHHPINQESKPGRRSSSASGFPL